MTVVGNGNIDVGSKSPTRKPGRSIVDGLARSNDASALRIDKPNSLPDHMKKRRPIICGAMSLQGGDSGRSNQSAPQEFVRLVGCRDPKAGSGPWVRPRPDPAKQ